MSQKYMIIMINGNIGVEADRLEVGENGHLNIYQKNTETGEVSLLLQANSRHWVAWMFSDGPSNIVTPQAGMVPPVGFSHRN